MATIRLCDWTKERLVKDEDTFKVMVGDQEFEVGEEGKKIILDQLEGEDAPQVQKVVYREAPPPQLVAGEPGIDIEVPGDPFETGPGSMPRPVQGNKDDLSMPNTSGGDDNVPPLEVPEDTKKRLKMPTPAQADKVIADSTHFEEGGLPALTMGGKEQKAAMKKLRAIEEKKEDELQRSARGGVRVSTNVRNKPGFYN